MPGEKVAVYLKTLDGFRGEARLYRVSPPMIRFITNRGGYYGGEAEYDYVVVDADVSLSGAKSTAIYGSDRDGNSICWIPIHLFQSTNDHNYVLRQANYQVSIEEDIDIMSKAWVERWVVSGTSGKDYTVAKKEDGTFGCDCPSWIFQKNKPRKDCQHILMKRIELGAIAVPSAAPSGKIQRVTKRSIRLED